MVTTGKCGLQRMKCKFTKTGENMVSKERSGQLCYAACPWASARPPFLFPHPIPALLFYSYLGSPFGSTFLGLLDHRVIPMPRPCLVYCYLPFFLSSPSLTHSISCTLLTLSLISYSSSSYSSLSYSSPLFTD